LTDESVKPFARSYIRLLLASTGVAVMVALLGYYPTVRLAGPAAIGSMLVGIGASLAAGCLGSLPIAFVDRSDPHNLVTAILLATGLRFLLVLAIAASLLLGGGYDRAVLGLWVGLSYLAMLVVDAIFAARMVGKLRENHE
jgi:hypothetical protein